MHPRRPLALAPRARCWLMVNLSSTEPLGFVTAHGRWGLWSPDERTRSYQSQSKVSPTSRRPGPRRRSAGKHPAWEKEQRRVRGLTAPSSKGHFPSGNNPCLPATHQTKCVLGIQCFSLGKKISLILQTQVLWLQCKSPTSSQPSNT